MAKTKSGFDGNRGNGGGGNDGGGGKGRSKPEKPLPQLTGSEKQVKWAEDIRKTAIDTIDSQLKWFKENLPQRSYDKEYMEASIEAYQEIKKAVTDAFMGMGEAKTVIDNRATFSQGRIQNVAEKAARAKMAKKKQ